jgi:beta-lactamase regulating signal transducer with metallopeptidase domain
MKSSFDAIAYWLIDYYIAATVVLIVVTLAHRAISQPARRLALHWGALVGLALLALMCAVPRWPRIDVVGVARAIPGAVGQPTHRISKTLRSDDLRDAQVAPVAASSRQQGPQAILSQSPQMALGGQGAIDSDISASATVLSDEPQGIFRWLTNRDLGPARLIALALFAVGCVLTTFRVIHGVLAARYVRLSASQAPRNVVAVLETLAGKENCPELLVSRSHPIPIVIGTLRPKILLPPQFAERERPDDCRSVLAHELAHIQNGDLWLLALDRWLLPLLWLHPLYLRLRRSLRDDQELLADTYAAGHSSRADYADMLVRWARRLLAEKRARQLAGAVGVWDRPTRLADRISRLLHQSPRLELCCPRTWRVGSLLSLIALPLLLSTATVRPDVSASSNFVGRLVSQSLVKSGKGPSKISCCCHRPSAVAAIPSPEDRIQYSIEQPAITKVERLGGSVKRGWVGSQPIVTEVNMVFHYTVDGRRVEHTIFTEEALPHISNFHHLKMLSLAGGQITNGGLRRVAALKELEGLSLRDARMVSCAGLAELTKLPQLRRLELTNAPICGAALAQLAALQSLEELSVEGSNLPVQSFEVVARMPNLTSLSLDLGEHVIGREAVLSLHALPNLKRLSLHCSEISDQAVLEIKSLTNLRLLSLGDSRVSWQALASLRQLLPDLAVKTARHTLRARSAVSAEQTRDDAPRSEEVVSKIRQFTHLVGESRARAAELMTDRPEVARHKILSIRIWPSLTNVDWKLAFVESSAALAVSSEFSNHSGATLVFACRMRRVGDEWKIEEFGATPVREGVEKTVMRFASAYPKARATDEWLAFPANVL